MQTAPPTLLLSPRYTPDSIALWKAALATGWNVERLPLGGRPSIAESREIVLYGEPFFAAAVAGTLKITLLEPPFPWLTHLSPELTRRRVKYRTLAEGRGITRPAFVKPADDKCFEARVYASGADLPPEDQLEGSVPVLVADPVVWLSEYRCFVLNGEARTASVYLRDGALAQADDGSWPMAEGEADEARRFADVVLRAADVSLPPAVVLDIGVIAGQGWAVVEANPVWASGLYGCDPAEALSVIRRACVPTEQVTAADRPWVVTR